MTLTRRNLVAASLAFPLIRTRPSLAATPVASPEEIGTLPRLWDLGITRYVPGFVPNPDARGIVFGHQFDPMLDAIDLADGSTRWSTNLDTALPDVAPIGMGLASVPQVGESVATGYTNGATMFGVDLESGDPLWHLSMNKPVGIDSAIGTALTIQKGSIYGIVKKNRLFSLDERSADVQWVSDVPMEHLWISTSPPIVGQTAVYLVDSLIRIHAIDRESGNHLWTHELGPDHQLAYVQVFGSVVLANLEHDGLKRIDPETGEDIWSTSEYLPMFDVHPSSDRQLVIGMGSSGEIVAIDLESGETRWKTGGVAGDRPLAFARGGSWLAIADSSDHVIVLDESNGEPKLELDARRLAVAFSGVTKAMALTEHSLFLSQSNMQLVGVDLESGQEITQASLVGISDEKVPVDLWPHGDLLIAVAPRIRMSAFDVSGR